MNEQELELKIKITENKFDILRLKNAICDAICGLQNIRTDAMMGRQVNQFETTELIKFLRKEIEEVRIT